MSPTELLPCYKGRISIIHVGKEHHNKIVVTGTTLTPAEARQRWEAVRLLLDDYSIRSPLTALDEQNLVLAQLVTNAGFRVYRALITDWIPTHYGTVKVLLVDEGEVDLEVGLGQLYSCPALIRQHKSIYQRFILADVYPVDDEWSSDSICLIKAELEHKTVDALFRENNQKVIYISPFGPGGEPFIAVLLAKEKAAIEKCLGKLRMKFLRKAGVDVEIQPAWSFMYSQIRMAPGSCENCHVLKIDKGPWNFYLQFEEQKAKQEVVDEKLLLLVHLKKLERICPKEGNAVLCFVNQHPCRGLVVKIESNQDITVYCVDKGLTVHKSFDDIWSLPEELIAIPVLTYRCCLHGLPRIEDDDVSKKFFALVLERPLVGHVIEYNDKLTTVSLFLSSQSVLLMIIPEHCEELYLPYKCNAVISYVHEENAIVYLQLTENQENLEKMQAKLQESTLRPVEGRLKRGLMCLAKYPEDGMWYRAIVVQARNPLIVYYVDYGNEAAVSLECVKHLDGSLIKDLPAQAIPCVLNDVNMKPLMYDDIDKVTGGATVNVQLVGTTLVQIGNVSRNVSLVELISNQTEVSVNTHLKQLQLRKDKNLFNNDGQDTNVGKYEWKQKGKCFLSQENNTHSSIHEKHIIRPPVINVMPKTIKKCKLSWAFTPLNFFLTLLDNEPTIEEMKRIMSEAFDYNPEIKFVENVKKGRLVAVFGKDNFWHRALVIFCDGYKINLFLVDSGMEESVYIHQLRALPDCLLTIPYQAFRCTLGDMHWIADCKASDQLKTMINRNFVVHFIDFFGGKWKVELNSEVGHTPDMLQSFSRGKTPFEGKKIGDRMSKPCKRLEKSYDVEPSCKKSTRRSYDADPVKKESTLSGLPEWRNVNSESDFGNDVQSRLEYRTSSRSKNDDVSDWIKQSVCESEGKFQNQGLRRFSSDKQDDCRENQSGLSNRWQQNENRQKKEFKVRFQKSYGPRLDSWRKTDERDGRKNQVEYDNWRNVAESGKEIESEYVFHNQEPTTDSLSKQYEVKNWREQNKFRDRLGPENSIDQRTSNVQRSGKYESGAFSLAHDRQTGHSLKTNTPLKEGCKSIPILDTVEESIESQSYMPVIEKPINVRKSSSEWKKEIDLKEVNNAKISDVFEQGKKTNWKCDSLGGKISDGAQFHVGESASLRKLAVPFGMLVDVKVTWILSPVKFYCQLINSFTSVLHAKMKAVQDECNRLSSEEVRYSFTKNQVVMALHTDGMWHRAKIMAMPGRTHTVQFLDSGELRSNLKSSAILPMKKGFAENIPALAVRVVISDLWPRCGVGWSVEATGTAVQKLQRADQCVFEKQLHSSGTCFATEVMVNGESYVDHLLNSCFAVKRSHSFGQELKCKVKLHGTDGSTTTQSQPIFGKKFLCSTDSFDVKQRHLLLNQDSQKTEKTPEKDISSFIQQVPIVTGMEVYLSHAETDGTVWLQRRVDFGLLQNIEEKMNYYVNDCKVFVIPEELLSIPPLSCKCVLYLLDTFDVHTMNWTLLLRNNCKKVLNVEVLGTCSGMYIVTITKEGQNILMVLSDLVMQTECTGSNKVGRVLRETDTYLRKSTNSQFLDIMQDDNVQKMPSNTVDAGGAVVFEHMTLQKSYPSKYFGNEMANQQTGFSRMIVTNPVTAVEEVPRKWLTNPVTAVKEFPRKQVPEVSDITFKEDDSVIKVNKGFPYSVKEFEQHTLKDKKVANKTKEDCTSDHSVSSLVIHDTCQGFTDRVPQDQPVQDRLALAPFQRMLDPQDKSLQDRLPLAPFQSMIMHRSQAKKESQKKIFPTELDTGLDECLVGQSLPKVSNKVSDEPHCEHKLPTDISNSYQYLEIQRKDVLTHHDEKTEPLVSELSLRLKSETLKFLEPEMLADYQSEPYLLKKQEKCWQQEVKDSLSEMNIKGCEGTAVTTVPERVEEQEDKVELQTYAVENLAEIASSNTKQTFGYHDLKESFPEAVSEWPCYRSSLESFLSDQNVQIQRTTCLCDERSEISISAPDDVLVKEINDSVCEHSHLKVTTEKKDVLHQVKSGLETEVIPYTKENIMPIHLPVMEDMLQGYDIKGMTQDFGSFLAKDVKEDIGDAVVYISKAEYSHNKDYQDIQKENASDCSEEKLVMEGKLGDVCKNAMDAYGEHVENLGEHLEGNSSYENSEGKCVSHNLKVVEYEESEVQDMLGEPQIQAVYRDSDEDVPEDIQGKDIFKDSQMIHVPEGHQQEVEVLALEEVENHECLPRGNLTLGLNMFSDIWNEDSSEDILQKAASENTKDIHGPRNSQSIDQLDHLHIEDPSKDLYIKDVPEKIQKDEFDENFVVSTYERAHESEDSLVQDAHGDMTLQYLLEHSQEMDEFIYTDVRAKVHDVHNHSEDMNISRESLVKPLVRYSKFDHIPEFHKNAPVDVSEEISFPVLVDSRLELAPDETDAPHLGNSSLDTAALLCTNESRVPIHPFVNDIDQGYDIPVVEDMTQDFKSLVFKDAKEDLKDPEISYLDNSIPENSCVIDLSTDLKKENGSHYSEEMFAIYDKCGDLCTNLLDVCREPPFLVGHLERKSTHRVPEDFQGKDDFKDSQMIDMSKDQQLEVELEALEVVGKHECLHGNDLPSDFNVFLDKFDKGSSADTKVINGPRNFESIDHLCHSQIDSLTEDLHVKDVPEETRKDVFDETFVASTHERTQMNESEDSLVENAHGDTQLQYLLEDSQEMDVLIYREARAEVEDVLEHSEEMNMSKESQLKPLVRFSKIDHIPEFHINAPVDASEISFHVLVDSHLELAPDEKHVPHQGNSGLETTALLCTNENRMPVHPFVKDNDVHQGHDIPVMKGMTQDFKSLGFNNAKEDIKDPEVSYSDNPVPENSCVSDLHTSLEKENGSEYSEEKFAVYDKHGDKCINSPDVCREPGFLVKRLVEDLQGNGIYGNSEEKYESHDPLVMKYEESDFKDMLGESENLDVYRDTYKDIPEGFLGMDDFKDSQVIDVPKDCQHEVFEASVIVGNLECLQGNDLPLDFNVFPDTLIKDSFEDTKVLTNLGNSQQMDQLDHSQIKDVSEDLDIMDVPEQTQRDVIDESVVRSIYEGTQASLGTLTLSCTDENTMLIHPFVKDNDIHQGYGIPVIKGVNEGFKSLVFKDAKEDLQDPEISYTNNSRLENSCISYLCTDLQQENTLDYSKEKFAVHHKRDVCTNSVDTCRKPLAEQLAENSEGNSTYGNSEEKYESHDHQSVKYEESQFRNKLEESQMQAVCRDAYENVLEDILFDGDLKNSQLIDVPEDHQEEVDSESLEVVENSKSMHKSDLTLSLISFSDPLIKDSSKVLLQKSAFEDTRVIKNSGNSHYMDHFDYSQIEDVSEDFHVKDLPEEVQKDVFESLDATVYEKTQVCELKNSLVQEGTQVDESGSLFQDAHGDMQFQNLLGVSQEMDILSFIHMGHVCEEIPEVNVTQDFSVFPLSEDSCQENESREADVLGVPEHSQVMDVSIELPLKSVLRCSAMDNIPEDSEVMIVPRGLLPDNAPCYFSHSVMTTDAICRHPSNHKCTRRAVPSEDILYNQERGLKQTNRLKDCGMKLKSSALGLKGLKPQKALTVGTAVYLSCIEENGRLWLQRTCDTNILKNLALRIRASLASVRVPSNLQEGMVCLAQSNEDHLWYRAVILNIFGRDVLVHFIDYGNSESISMKQILDIQADILSERQLSYGFKLKISNVSQENTSLNSVLDAYWDKELMMASVDTNELETFTLTCDTQNVLEGYGILEFISFLEYAGKHYPVNIQEGQDFSKEGSDMQREHMFSEMHSEKSSKNHGRKLRTKKGLKIPRLPRFMKEESDMRRKQMCFEEEFKVQQEHDNMSDDHSVRVPVWKGTKENIKFMTAPFADVLNDSISTHSFSEMSSEEKVIHENVNEKCKLKKCLQVEDPLPSKVDIRTPVIEFAQHLGRPSKDVFIPCKRNEKFRSSLHVIEEVEESEAFGITEVEVNPYNAFLVHVEEFPFSLWVQREEDIDLAEFVEHCLQELGDDLQLVEAPRINQLCISLLYGCRQRVQVTALSDSNASVHYIDQGRYGVVSHKELWKLQDELNDIQPLATQIFLPVTVVPERKSEAALAVTEAAFHNMCACLDLNQVGPSSEMKYTLFSVPGVGDLGNLLVNGDFALSRNWEKEIGLHMASIIKKKMEEAVNALHNDQLHGNSMHVAAITSLAEKIDKLTLALESNP
ncbi:uncharacterized protein [Panulirus ornatus]|uniref:uncharacterized protein isoform X2 n=1 Tax=Panulirus ornatus TaxID=150431 RepID=UPI003A8B8392